jgi:hypothetical protein
LGQLLSAGAVLTACVKFITNYTLPVGYLTRHILLPPPFVSLQIVEDPGMGLCLITKRYFFSYRTLTKKSYQPAFVSIRFQGANYATQSGAVFAIDQKQILSQVGAGWWLLL